MVARATLAWIEPYLDGQLSPPETALLEKALLDDAELLSFFHAKKAFHQFIQRALAAVCVPDGFEDRLRFRLAQVTAVVGAVSGDAPVDRLSRRWWKGSAAVLLACCCLIAYQVLCAPAGLCRYIAACTFEYQRVMDGTLPLGIASTDPAELVRYAGQRAVVGVEHLPELNGHRPVGAGRAAFSQLHSLGAPEGLFFRYEDATGRPLLLFVHAWPSENPTAELMEYNGLAYWSAKHGTVGFVGWKSTDGRVLKALTGDQAMSELLRLAAEARSSERVQDGLFAAPAKLR